MIGLGGLIQVRSMRIKPQSLLPLLLLLAAPALGVVGRGVDLRADVVSVRGESGQLAELCGKVLAQTADELLLVTPDGQMHLLASDQVRQVQIDDRPLRPLTPAELAPRLEAEFGPTFQVLQSRHYLVVYNTERTYAQATATMLERLYAAFTRYYRLRGFTIQRARFPLVAVLFRTRDEFADYAARELEVVDPRINGYYSLETNRLALHQVLPPGRYTRGRLSPENVSTIAHEGVHQLAFNLGFLKRFSDPPLWLVEGMAMFFEVPAGTTGRWGGVGAVNHNRLEQFLSYVQEGRPQDSLRQLIASDDRIRQLDQAVAAYAESWALTYYLVRTQARRYFEYLQHLGKKPYLWQGSPEERVREFEQFFGPIEAVDAELVKYMKAIARQQRKPRSVRDRLLAR